MQVYIDGQLPVMPIVTNPYTGESLIQHLLLHVDRKFASELETSV